MLRTWQKRTHCCRHKCFPVCPRAQHLSRTQKKLLILFRNILCPQQMFPSLRSPRNIMGNNVSGTMCPRLPGPLELINSACIHNNVRHHTELFEKSNKIKEGETHSKPATKSLENLCN